MNHSETSFSSAFSALMKQTRASSMRPLRFSGGRSSADDRAFSFTSYSRTSQCRKRTRMAGQGTPLPHKRPSLNRGPGMASAMGERPMILRARDVEWEFDRTLVMGIVNVTPDSFSDGGEHVTDETAVAHALRLAEEGADILDVGGESTRPGAQPVDAEEEWRRIAIVIETIDRKTDVPISVDTYKPEIARKAIRAGAVIVNDVRGLMDMEMKRVIANSGAGAVIMHMQGEPATMQENPQYEDVVAEVRAFLTRQMAAA